MNLVISQAITIQTGQATSAPVMRRVLHDAEMGEPWRLKLPEVQPLKEDTHFTPFTEALQRLSFALNPHLTPQKWTAVYDWGTVITNGQGYGKPGDPRANFITGENLTKPLPKVESLLFGGACFVVSQDLGGWVVPETINGRAPAPTLEYILAHPWLMCDFVCVRGDGLPGMAPQGDGTPVKILLITDRDNYPDARIEKAKTATWAGPGMADPYRIYAPR